MIPRTAEFSIPSDARRMMPSHFLAPGREDAIAQEYHPQRSIHQTSSLPKRLTVAELFASHAARAQAAAASSDQQQTHDDGTSGHQQV